MNNVIDINFSTPDFIKRIINDPDFIKYLELIKLKHKMEIMALKHEIENLEYVLNDYDIVKCFDCSKYVYIGNDDQDLSCNDCNEQVCDNCIKICYLCDNNYFCRDCYTKHVYRNHSE
jgi:hypothetical protein